jgi:hypothetical protein
MQFFTYVVLILFEIPSYYCFYISENPVWVKVHDFNSRLKSHINGLFLKLLISYLFKNVRPDTYDDVIDADLQGRY